MNPSWRPPILSLASLLVVALGACAPRARHPAAPTPPARVDEASAPVRNVHVFAADGMCADQLVRHHLGLRRLQHKIRRTLETRLNEYREARAHVRHARYWPRASREARAAERLKFTWSGWLEVRRPFDERYGEYTCLRRDDLTPLTSAEFDEGMAPVRAVVGDLGPLPTPEPNELQD